MIPYLSAPVVAPEEVDGHAQPRAEAPEVCSHHNILEGAAPLRNLHRCRMLNYPS